MKHKERYMRHHSTHHHHGGFRRPGPGRDTGDSARGSRRRRLFDQAELQTLLLSLIGEQPRHGYDLIREIEGQTGGEYVPSPGIVYPALTFMEESGLIEMLDEGTARKSYRLTATGEAQIEQDRDAAAALRQRLASLAAAKDRADPAPVRRAMQNLKAAALNRLSQGEPDREVVFQIAEAIDEAARRIERIEG